jgi:16S rRNA (guanine966-N2)-methyltransferase
MTRIIAGAYGGRRIETPKGDGTRPTSDRVREAMFSSIQSELGGFDGVRVLDLYAGSGALGLEAMSRGAEFGQFVESDQRAAAVIKRNISKLGANASVTRATVTAYLERPHDDREFDLVFLDPPYAVTTDQVQGVIRNLSALIEPDALIVVERSSRDPFTWPEGVEGLRDKAYGETRVWYGR